MIPFFLQHAASDKLGKEKQVSGLFFLLFKEELPWAVEGVLVVPEPDFEKPLFSSSVTNEVQ